MLPQMEPPVRQPPQPATH